MNLKVKSKDVNERLIGSTIGIEGLVKDFSSLNEFNSFKLVDDFGYVKCIDITKSIKVKNNRYYRVIGLVEKSNEIYLKVLNCIEIEVNKFLIDNDILKKLKPRIVKCAKLIKDFVDNNNFILIRHHNDCDGYSGAIALERAIVSLIEEKDKNHRFFYKRIPMLTPYYDYFDVIQDLNIANENKKRYSKDTLIILVDNGSSREDLIGIKKLNIYGIKVIVIDHHYPVKVNDESLTDRYALHINPYIVEGDNSFTSGMLCTEIARFINPFVKNIEFLPVLSGIGDKVKDFKGYEKYVKDLDFLVKVSKVIDFLSNFIRRSESSIFVDDLLGNDAEKQRKIVELLYPDVIKAEKKRLKQLLKYKKEIKYENKIIVIVNLDDIINKEYPPHGKSIGILFDYYEHKFDIVCVIGINRDSLIVRMKGFNKDLNEFVSICEKKFYTEFISGGGHENAGTIRFTPKIKEEVVNLFLKWISEY